MTKEKVYVSMMKRGYDGVAGMLRVLEAVTSREDVCLEMLED